jgi:hypothetical protein
MEKYQRLRDELRNLCETRMCVQSSEVENVLIEVQNEEMDC